MDPGYLLLGLIQGVFEYLPISSSLHLNLLGNWLFPGFSPELRLALNVFLHLGTLVSLAWFLRRRILSLILSLIRLIVFPIRPNPGLHQWALIILASIPTALIGLYMKLNQVTNISLPLQGGLLLLTGYLLYSSPRIPSGQSTPTYLHAVILGLVQGVCVIPGLSRSGILFCTALALGIRRDYALEFIFLIGLPAVLGATFVTLPDLLAQWPNLHHLSLTWAFLLALVSSLSCLKFLHIVYSPSVLRGLGVYCQALGYVLLFGVMIRTLASIGVAV